MKIMMLYLMLLPTIVYAHTADKPCPAGQFSQDGCQPRVKALHLDSDEFNAASQAYWHCRRHLETLGLMKLAACVGALQAEGALLGLKIFPTSQEQSLLVYMDVVPAHPELDLVDSSDIPANILQADAHTEACTITIGITAGVISECERKKVWMETQIKRRFRR